MSGVPTIARPGYVFVPLEPSVEPTPRWIRVRFGGETIADSRRALLLLQIGPGRLPTYYFPLADVRLDLLEPRATTSRCPLKGVARYWSARVGGRVVPDLAWGYPEPIAECPKIRGLICFYNERVDLSVDGEREPRPRTPWSEAYPDTAADEGA